MMKVEDVHSREELVLFLAALAQDVDKGVDHVENERSADLLEAASAWIKDMDGYFINAGEDVPSTPSWRLIALIFAASLEYE